MAEVMVLSPALPPWVEDRFFVSFVGESTGAGVVSVLFVPVAITFVGLVRADELG